jgi:tripartite-type tricarboxylate transporter receptor subunit TctC
VLASIAWLGHSRAAEDYPSRQVRIIVPAGAGGVTDIVARIVADKLSERFGKAFFVENISGAGGIIGTQTVARADPDGYTLLVVSPSHTANPSLYSKLPYDTNRSFAPVTMLTKIGLVLCVPAGSAAHSVADLIADAKAAPAAYASIGVGSLGHLAAELFRVRAGISLTNITYRAVPAAETAVLRGEVSMFFDAATTAIPQIFGGEVKALAVTTAHRLAKLPDIPTVAEAGLTDYDVTGWNGIVAPAKTPPEIIDRLNKAIVTILNEDDVRARLEKLEMEPAGEKPEEFGAAISADIEKWARLIHQANIGPLE